MDDIVAAPLKSASSSVFTDTVVPPYKNAKDNFKFRNRQEKQPKCTDGLLQDAVNAYHEKRGIKYSKSMVENFTAWLGISSIYQDSDKWREHIRRRRIHNRLVGQYKENVPNDIISAIITSQQTPLTSFAPTFYLQQPVIIDPYARHSRSALNRQVSKISTSSTSKRMSRMHNPVSFGAKESVFKMAYNGLINAITPTSLKDNITWPHHRSVTTLQIKNEAPRIVSTDNDEEMCLDDVFFNDFVSSETNPDTPDTVFSYWKLVEITITT